MHTLRKRSFTTGLIAAVMLSSVIVAAPSATAAESHTSTNRVATARTLDPSLVNEAQEMEAGLNYIMSIPDDVLRAGDEATNAWTRQHQPAGSPSIADDMTISTYASVWGCTAAIIGVTAGNIVGAAKLLKIKKYIQALGGVKQAVQLMWGASFSYEKMAAVGGALGALAGELTGITAVRKECFQ